MQGHYQFGINFMDFLKNIKSIFVADDASASPPPAHEVLLEVAKAAPTAVAPAPAAAYVSAGEVTEKFTKILLQSLDEHNLQGFDYLEFKQSVQSLSKMPMDEATRFQAAFSMAQTMGATPQKLVEAANQYLGVLQKEQQKFQGVLVQQRANLVGSREQQMAQLQQNATAKAAQIDKLTQEIAQHSAQIELLEKEIEEAAQKVETASGNFNASYESLVAQIQTDIKNIQVYLK